MIKQNTEDSLKNSLNFISEEPVLETPKLKKTKQVTNQYTPSPVKRLKNSPYKSHSFSSLQRLQQSPSQMSAKKLLRKYNSNVVKLSGQRREISSLRKSLPHSTPTTSDLDLVLEAITYIQQLQQKLVTMTAAPMTAVAAGDSSYNERLV